MSKSKELASLLHPCRADVGGLITEMSSLLLCQLWLLISLLWPTSLVDLACHGFGLTYLASKADGGYPYTLYCLCVIFHLRVPEYVPDVRPNLQLLFILWSTSLTQCKHFFNSVWSSSWELFCIECKIFPLTSVRTILFLSPTKLKENEASKVNLPRTLIITTTVVQKAKG